MKALVAGILRAAPARVGMALGALLVLLAGPGAVGPAAARTEGLAAAGPTQHRLCGTPVSAPGTAFPRILHLGKPGSGSLAASVSERSGHAFIALDGVSENGGNSFCRASMTTINVRNGSVLRTVPLGSTSVVVAVDDLAGRVYAVGFQEAGADPRRGALTILDTKGRIVRRLRDLDLCACPTGGGPSTLQLAVAHAAGRIFIGTGGSLITLEAGSGHLLSTVPAVGRFVLDQPEGRLVFGTSSEVRIVDTRTGRVLDSETLSYVGGFLLDERLRRLFIAKPTGVAVIDVRSGSVVQMIPLGLAPGEASHPVGEDVQTGTLFYEAWIPGTYCGHAPGGPGAVLAVLNARTGKLLRSLFETCSRFNVTVDPYTHRAYVYSEDYPAGSGYYFHAATLDSRDGRVLSETNNLSGIVDPPPMLLAVGPGTGRLYYLYAHCPRLGCSATLKVVSPALRVLHTIPVPDNVPILQSDASTVIADSAGRLLVGDPFARSVTIVATNPVR